VRKILWTIFGLWFCGLLVAARADTFQLADGTPLTGDIVTFNDTGITFRMADDSYTNVLWTKFSQDALKQLSSNPKIKPLVEPFIEISASERPQKPEVKIGEVTRLELPPRQSLLGALLSSSVGLVALLLIYAANIYAGYEIAALRGWALALAIPVSAVLPIIGPAIFLVLPTKREAVTIEIPEASAAADPTTFAVPGQQPQPAAPEINIVAASWQTPPVAQIFQRGQFTFNRRFFETKFSGFFGAVRRGADKDSVLTVKSTRGELIVERITRIAANDVHFEITQGGASQEVMVPFADIQEIQLKPKNA
jgi:hypothetical protein